MNFQTPVDVSPLPHKIAYPHHLLCMGSCFAAGMGKRLEENKFKAMTNPLGIAFNPLSLFRLIRIGLGRVDPQPEMHPRLNYAFSFDFHTHFSYESTEEFAHNLDNIRAAFIPWIQKMDFLILTFGTAYVYEKVGEGTLVNNCHKFPGDHFRRRMLSPEEIATGFSQLIALLHEIRPGFQVILTVSPIRHIRDGLSVSSLSKSILRYSCELIQQQNREVHYFPSYEIMLDELRDYRFFAEDMIHPNDQAGRIIWEKFIHSSLDSESLEVLKKWQKIRTELQHRPLHPWSQEYFFFLEKLITKLQKMKKIGLDTSQEQVFIQKSIDHWHKKYGTMQKK